jgi:hypothetical protein
MQNGEAGNWGFSDGGWGMQDGESGNYDIGMQCNLQLNSQGRRIGKLGGGDCDLGKIRPPCNNVMSGYLSLI